MAQTARRLMLGLLALLVLADPLAAVPTPDLPREDSPAARIRKALDTPVNGDLQNLTLTQAVDRLAEQAKINIVLDRMTIMMRGVLPDEMPVNVKMPNAKLRVVLQRLLAQGNLSYVIDGDVLLITTEDVALQRQVRQRVSLDLDKVPFEQALKELAQDTGANLVLDPRFAAKAKEPVTLRLDEVPLEVAVRLMAEMVGLRSVRQANVLFVTSKEIAAELRKEEETVNPPVPFIPPFVGGFGGVRAGPAPVVPVPAVPVDPPFPPPKPPADGDGDDRGR